MPTPICGLALRISTASRYQGQAIITEVEKGTPVSMSSRTARLTVCDIPTSSQRMRSCFGRSSSAASETVERDINAVSTSTVVITRSGEIS